MGKTIGVVLALKDRCSPVIVGVAQKFGMTTKKAKALNEELRKQAKLVDGALKTALQGATIVIGATIGAVGALTSKTMEYGDRVDKMSQKIGMSRQSFQEWDYVMSQNGGSIDSLQMGFKALANQMEGVRKGSKDSIGYFKRLGVSVKDSRGQFRRQEDVFNDTVRALQNMKNPTEKAIITNNLFGRSAIEMKPLLNQTAASVDALRKKANDLGMVMSDEAVDSSVKLTDTMDTLKRSFGAIGLSLGAQLIPTVQQLADQLINNLPQIKATLVPVISAFANVIGFTCQHLDVIIPAIGALVGVFTMLKVVTTVTGFIAAFCNLVGLAVVAIGTLIATIGVARAKGLGFLDALKEIFKVITGGIGAVAKLAGAIFGLKNAFGGAKAQGVGKEVLKDNVPHHALGTVSARGGAALVGEYGPEIVNVPRGAGVVNANDTKKALACGSNITINMNIAGNVLGNREFLNEIMNAMALELRKVMPA